MADAILKWLLIGTGDIVRKRVASALAPNLVGVCGGGGRAQTIADEHGASEVFDDVDDALANTAADAVYVATAVYRHRDEAIKAAVAAIPVDPAEAFYEGVKFSRLMKGRLLFYAEEILWFDSVWLIHNELGRIVANFHDKPLMTYGIVRFGEKLAPAQVLDRVRGEVLDPAACDGMAEFARRAGAPIREGCEKQQARDVAEVFDDVLVTIETLGADLMQRMESEA